MYELRKFWDVIVVCNISRRNKIIFSIIQINFFAISCKRKYGFIIYVGVERKMVIFNLNTLLIDFIMHLQLSGC